MKAAQPEPEHDEGKRRAVVESRLARERDAEAVAVARIRDLNLRGEDRIRRSEHRSEKDRDAEGKSEHRHADGRDQADRHRHRDEREANRLAPQKIARIEPQLQTGAEERDDDRDLGEALEERGILERMEVEQIRAFGAEQVAGGQVDDRRRERESAHGRVPRRERDEENPENDVPVDRDVHPGSAGCGFLARGPASCELPLATYSSTAVDRCPRGRPRT